MWSVEAAAAVSLDLGAGTTGSALPPVTVRVLNGGTQTLTVAGFSSQTTRASVTVMPSSGTTGCAAAAPGALSSLPPGQSCDIEVVVTPTAPGPVEVRIQPLSVPVVAGELDLAATGSGAVPGTVATNVGASGCSGSNPMAALRPAIPDPTLPTLALGALGFVWRRRRTPAAANAQAQVPAGLPPEAANGSVDSNPTSTSTPT